MKRLHKDERHRVAVVLNGVPRSGWVEPRMLLSDFVRDSLGATGTHVGCEQGACGACTLHVDGVATRSCLMLAVQADGCRIDTVEGLAGEQGALHPMQQAFRRCHALQCGFCTPGILMSCVQGGERLPCASEQGLAADADLRHCPRDADGHVPSAERAAMMAQELPIAGSMVTAGEAGLSQTAGAVRRQLVGHLCRCTGYTNIVHAVQLARASAATEKAGQGDA